MSFTSKKELIAKTKERYLGAKRQEKSILLDELVANTEMHRKYLVSLLSPKKDLSYISPINRKRRQQYGSDVVLYLKKIWKIFDYPCGQRLKPMLMEYVRVLEKCGELIVPISVKKKFMTISSSTIDRRLKKTREDEKRKVFSTTKPGGMLKSQIPIKTSSWDEKRIGFGELDTVAHCGDSASGEFISSLTYTDILTQWTESEATMGKAQERIMTALDRIKKRIPFDMLGIDPDNGGEFINWQLYKYCMTRNIEFTRGRPYKKNDNAHIEQKNWTHIRKLAGYKRLNTEKQLKILNDLYRNEWRLYKNFFQANKKLVEKKRVGTRIVKKYDTPKTPYQRVLESKEVLEEKREELRKVYEMLNPAELKRSIDKKISRL